MRIQARPELFQSLAVFPIGNAIAIGTDVDEPCYKGVKVYDVAENRLMHSLSARNVWCLTVFPTCDRLLTGSTDGTAIIWDLATEQIVQTFAEHSSSVSCVAVNAMGDTVFLGDNLGNVYQWQEVRKVPLALSSEEDGGLLRVKCHNLAGRELAEFSGLSAQDPLATLTALIHGRIQPPAGARWQPVLPSMVCVEDSQLHVPLGELFAPPTDISAAPSSDAANGGGES